MCAKAIMCPVPVVVVFASLNPYHPICGVCSDRALAATN